MRISLSPFAPLPQFPKQLTVVKLGDVLTINGEVFDFSSLPDGATIPPGEIPSEWIVGPVERIAGELHLTLLLPHGRAPEPWQAFPAPLEAVPDGPVDIPFDTTVAIERTPAPGGFIIKTTTRRWHQPDQVDVTFEAASEESDNVDA